LIGVEPQLYVGLIKIKTNDVEYFFPTGKKKH